MNERMIRREITLCVNGEEHDLAVRTADTLLHVLREQLGLTSAKPSCENGDCGACTVLLDDVPVKACLVLAVEAEGHRITTMEGLQNTPISRAFLAKSAVQCGYCTPGFVVNAHALVTAHPTADEATIREWLESNLCRCLGYQEIEEAVKSVLPGNTH